MEENMQNEITVAKDLLNEKGLLKESGWARRPLLKYQRKAIAANRFRIKEWDYYLILNDKHALALTIADNSYMGLMSVSLLDFESDVQHTNSVMTAFPMGRMHLPESSASGITHFENDQLQLRFEAGENGRDVSCLYKNFQPGKDLKAEVHMDQAFEDSIVMATPWKEDRKAFYYNQKINCMPAEGSCEFDGRQIVFSKADSFGTLDWGRGVWTRTNTWFWGSGNGWVDGRRFGFNLGYGFGDTSAASENILFYDGVAHKLDHVTFKIGDENDLMIPWVISDNENRLRFDFIPVMDRAAAVNALILSTDQHQVFGRVSGFFVLDNGRRMTVKNLMCFFEKVKNVY